MSNWTASMVKAERALRAAIRTSLLDWAVLALAPQGHSPAAHHRLLIDELEGLAAGRSDRLMLLMPPGSAKSTYASLVFPPWFFAQRPQGHLIAASHTAGLAWSFGRGVRGLIDEHQGPVGGGGPATQSGGRAVRDRGGRQLFRDWRAGACDGAPGRPADRR